MKQSKRFIALCLIGLILSIALAACETIDIGPAKFSIGTEDIGSFAVIKGDPSYADHKNPDFQYQIYPASIISNDSPNQVLIEVHHMSISEPLEVPISRKDPSTGLEHCVEKSNLISPTDDAQKEPYVIDDRKGILVTITKDKNKENPLYIVAYSPDQEKMQEELYLLSDPIFHGKLQRAFLTPLRQNWLECFILSFYALM